MLLFGSIVSFMLAVLWLLLKPAPFQEAQARMKPFAGLRYAHRGLFDPEAGVPENSLAAFQRAADAGFGIELDLHLTADGRLVVYHDDNLLRGCGLDKAVADCAYPELAGLALFGTGHKIPLFSQVLEAVAGRVPLILEIKYQKNYDALCRALMLMLDGYTGRGLCCVESFHPAVVRWFMQHRPDICRGLLSMDYSREDKHQHRLTRFLCGNLLVNGFCRPHFLAYCQVDVRKFAFRLCQKLFHTPAVAWTVRSLAREWELISHYDAVIFEGYLPDSPRLGG